MPRKEVGQTWHTDLTNEAESISKVSEFENSLSFYDHHHQNHCWYCGCFSAILLIVHFNNNSFIWTARSDAGKGDWKFQFWFCILTLRPEESRHPDSSTSNSVKHSAFRKRESYGVNNKARYLIVSCFNLFRYTSYQPVPILLLYKKSIHFFIFNSYSAYTNFLSCLRVLCSRHIQLTGHKLFNTGGSTVVHGTFKF